MILSQVNAARTVPLTITRKITLASFNAMGTKLVQNVCPPQPSLGQPGRYGKRYHDSYHLRCHLCSSRRAHSLPGAWRLRLIRTAMLMPHQWTVFVNYPPPLYKLRQCTQLLRSLHLL